VSTILYNAQPTTSDAALYTATSNTPFTHVIAQNATGGAATVTLSVHRAGSGVAETIASATSVPAGSALNLVSSRLLADEEFILYNGDSIHGLASAGTTITVLVF
jgi:hypothetical protein